MTTYTIPVYQPELFSNEKRHVLECLDSTSGSAKGRFLAEFEGRCANFVGAKYAVGVCSVTVAFRLALVTFGVGSGDEVIVPP
jgi:perosamine synthetase